MLATLATVSDHLAPDPGGTGCSQVWQEVVQLCGYANNGTVRSDRGPFEECGQSGYQGVMCMPEQKQCLFGVVDLALNFKRTG